MQVQTISILDNDVNFKSQQQGNMLTGIKLTGPILQPTSTVKQGNHGK